MGHIGTSTIMGPVRLLKGGKLKEYEVWSMTTPAVVAVEVRNPTKWASLNLGQ